ncbi:hypothetical protein NLJ89_g8726 [Agrocybe chaxingu]|uniref:Nucleoplasmin-like domain-containing protein n=1 Tax=Agrocybe chaxingu TaxID=84603 RepID=A0A9W8MQI5_9AGAR|nr:hypothetical protein NLJ89_g8726 [Agrocybe chaxingu]
MPQLWCHVLQQGRALVFVPARTIILGQASLGHRISDSKGRTSLSISYNISPEEVRSVVLCAFAVGKIEQTTFNVCLDPQTEYTLKVLGKNEIHLIGKYVEPEEKLLHPAAVDLPPDRVSLGSSVVGTMPARLVVLEASAMKARAAVSVQALKPTWGVAPTKPEDIAPMSLVEDLSEFDFQLPVLEETQLENVASPSTCTIHSTAGSLHCLPYTWTQVIKTGLGSPVSLKDRVSVRLQARFGGQTGYIYDEDSMKGGNPLSFIVGENTVIKGRCLVLRAI